MKLNIHIHSALRIFMILLSAIVMPIVSYSQTNSNSVDTLNISPDALESKVIYKATDSITFDIANQKVFLYGKAEVYYESVELKAQTIELNLDSNTVTAKGELDSLGNYIGKPEFKDGDQTFITNKVGYNFKTKKGLITNVMTEEGGGYIHAKKAYKTDGDILYIKNGSYTTCNLEKPHFYFSAAKLKIIPHDKIITGPANLVIEDIPTPLSIPFGFFPNSKTQKSGLIIPEPGESSNYGFFLRNGGYYWSIGKKMNAQFTGDFYSKGSWGTRVLTNYKNRYHFSGSVDATYSIFKHSIKEFTDYSETRNFFIKWKHTQDPKARPNSIFSANVNLGTRANFTNNINSSATDYLSANFNSSISYKKSWTGTPFSFSVNGYHNQNVLSGAVTIRLPEAAFNVSRIYPLKRKSSIGNQRLYEKIGVSYTMNTKNQLTTGDSLLSLSNLSNLTKDIRNGIKQTIPLSTSFKLLKHFNVNPAINYSEIWHFQSIKKTWNSPSNVVETDTLSSFSRGHTLSMSTNLTTKIYGIYQYKGKRIKALRHVITPSVGFSYVPKNNSGLKSYTDSSNTVIDYSIFQDGIYGTTHSLESGNLNLSLLNNFEMKVKSKKDTINPIKKIKLLENLSFSSSYNIAADSFNWSNINMSARTYLFKKVFLNFSGILDPYALDTSGVRINTSQWKERKQLGRLTSANLAFGFSLKSKKKNNTQEKTSKYASEQEMDYIRSNPDAYIDFDIPWTLSVNYNIRYSRPQFKASEDFTQTLNFTGDFSLTEKWKVGFTSGYDFKAKDLSFTTIDIYRDLHCWEIRFNWIPFGPRQSYLFTIKVKSAVLQDLKLTKRNLPNVL